MMNQFTCNPIFTLIFAPRSYERLGPIFIPPLCQGCRYAIFRYSTAAQSKDGRPPFFLFCLTNGIAQLAPNGSIIDALAGRRLKALFGIVSQLEAIHAPLIIPCNQNVNGVLCPFTHLKIRSSIRPWPCSVRIANRVVQRSTAVARSVVFLE